MPDGLWLDVRDVRDYLAASEVGRAETLFLLCTHKVVMQR